MKAKEMPMMDLMNQAMKNYEEAVRTGFKLQEEGAQWWSKSFNPAAAAQDWEKRFSEFSGTARDLMPMAQQQMAGLLDLMQKNRQVGEALMKKAAEAAQTQDLAESQAKWMDFWRASLGAVRTNNEALAQFNARAIGSCLDFMRKSAEACKFQMPLAA